MEVEYTEEQLYISQHFCPPNLPIAVHRKREFITSKVFLYLIICNRRCHSTELADVSGDLHRTESTRNIKGFFFFK